MTLSLLFLTSSDWEAPSGAVLVSKRSARRSCHVECQYALACTAAGSSSVLKFARTVCSAWFGVVTVDALCHMGRRRCQEWEGFQQVVPGTNPAAECKFCRTRMAANDKLLLSQHAIGCISMPSPIKDHHLRCLQQRRSNPGRRKRRAQDQTVRQACAEQSMQNMFGV